MNNRSILSRFTFLSLSGLLAAAAPARAELSNGKEVADRAAAVSYYQGEDGSADVRMEITDSQGRVREREMTILRKDRGEDLGEQQFFVYFQAPADVARTTFLVWKNPEADDDRWLYLPALDLVRRIAASDERTSFVGSHFYYEDVSGRSPGEDDHELEEVTDTYYVLRSTPKDPDAVEFDHYRSWIHKETFLPVRTEYYRADGEVYRRYEALAVETIDGFPTVVRSRMSDLDRDGSTVLEYSNVRYDRGLDADIFEERYLRNPPAEVVDR